MRRVVTFVFLAYGFSWSYWGWMLATGRMSGPNSSATHLPGLAGPALAALITIALHDGAPGLARLGRAVVTIPERRGMAVAAILAPPVAGLLLLAALAEPFPTLEALLAYPGIPAGTPLVLAIVIAVGFNALGEELGWRGELLPTLLPRLGRLKATLAVAAIWAPWHAPAFLVADSLQDTLGVALIGWAVGLTLGAFVLSHLYIATGGSLLAVILWHAAFNYSVATGATEGVPQAAVSTLVMLWGLVIAWRWARRG